MTFSGAEKDHRRTVVGFPVADRVMMFVGLPAIGLVLAAVLPPVARWASDLRIALPVRPVFRLLAAVDRPWEIGACLAAGALLGLWLAFVALVESTTVTLTDMELRVDREKRHRVIPRADVDVVFLDRKHLVVLDRESRQLARDVHEAPARVLAGAFTAHGYPWRDGDPYADLYRRWVHGMPDLPAAVDAVFSAREVALRKKAGEDAADLAEAIQNLGYVVRDEGNRQYWRPLVRS